MAFTCVGSHRLNTELTFVLSLKLIAILNGRIYMYKDLEIFGKQTIILLQVMGFNRDRLCNVCY